MPNEIRATIDLKATKGNLSLKKRVAMTIDMAGGSYTSKVKSIGTTHELLDIGSDVATAGMTVLQNHDATNFVEIGIEESGSLAFIPLLALPPGEAQLVRLASKLVWARADTAAVPLEIIVLEA